MRGALAAAAGGGPTSMGLRPFTCSMLRMGVEMTGPSPLITSKSMLRVREQGVSKTPAQALPPLSCGEPRSKVCAPQRGQRRQDVAEHDYTVRLVRPPRLRQSRKHNERLAALVPARLAQHSLQAG